MRPRFPPLELWELDPDSSSKEWPPWLEVCLSFLSEETEQITLCFLHRLCAPLQGRYFHLLQFMLVIETWCNLKNRIIRTSHLATIWLRSWFLTTFLSRNGVLHSLQRTSWILIMRSEKNKEKKTGLESRYTDDLKDSCLGGICHALTVNELKILPLSDNINGDETFSRIPLCIQKSVWSVWKWKGNCVKGNNSLLKRLKEHHLLKAPSEGHTFCWASLNQSSFIMSVRQRRLIQARSSSNI